MEQFNPDENCYILFNFIGTNRRKTVRLVSINYNPTNDSDADRIMAEISSNITLAKGVEIDWHENMTIEYISENL
jgi:hypothetical protein